MGEAHENVMLIELTEYELDELYDGNEQLVEDDFGDVTAVVRPSG